MNRSALYAVIVILVAGLGVLGYRLYQEQHKSGVEISVGGKGIAIETK